MPQAIKYNKKTKILITSQYIQGRSIKEISNFIGVSYPIVSKWLKSWGVPVIAGKMKVYSCNDNYFDKIDKEDKAYWLGMLATDGCVLDNCIYLSLAKIDKEHLETFILDIEGDQKLYFTRKEYILRILSKHMVDVLYNYNIEERKTYIVSPPVLLFSLMKHYWRGCIDGDGTIDVNRCQISLTGNDIMTKEFRKWCLKQNRFVEK